VFSEKFDSLRLHTSSFAVQTPLLLENPTKPEPTLLVVGCWMGPTWYLTTIGKFAAGMPFKAGQQK